MHPFHPAHPAICLVLAAATCVCGVACKPSATPKPASDLTPGEQPASSFPAAQGHRPPGTAELADFVRSGLPPVVRLVELKNDPPVRRANSAPGSEAWRYNVRLSFAPVEDELGPPPPQVAAAFQATLDELNGLVAWSQAYAQSPYASLSPGFSVEPPDPAAPTLLRVLHAKDRPAAPIYAKLDAEWEIDHWVFSMEEGAALPADEGGHFRSEYTNPILIQGEPATDRFVAAAKAAVAQAKPKREAIEAAYQADLHKATQPGTLYKGQISRGGSTMPAEVRFVAPAGGDPAFARCELRLPATGYLYVMSVRLAARVPNLPLAAAGASEQAERGPRTDLTISYERTDVPQPFPQNPFATDFFYHTRDTSSGWLNLRNHQLKGKAAVFLDTPGFVLTAQQVP